MGVSMLEILCTHVYKWKMRPLETIAGIGGRGKKKNYGGGKSTMIYYKKSYKCHNVPPVKQ
jgi:hypothetical protein